MTWRGAWALYTIRAGLRRGVFDGGTAKHGGGMFGSRNTLLYYIGGHINLCGKLALGNSSVRSTEGFTYRAPMS